MNEHYGFIETQYFYTFFFQTSKVVYL